MTSSGQSMENLQVKLTTLSPLHIGSGHVYTQFDTMVKGDYLYVIEIDDTAKLLMKNGKTPEEISKVILEKAQQAGIKALIEYYKLEPETIATHKIRLDCSRVSFNEVHGFIKSPLYNINYLPGSSIKGAIRTALLWYHLSKNGITFNMDNYQQGKKDIDSIENNELGTFNNSIMKYLHISDSIDKEQKQSCLMEINLASLGQTSVYYECLQSDETFGVLMKLDKERAKDLRNHYLLEPATLINACNAFSEYQILEDCKYLKNNNLLDQSLNGFYDNLAQKMNNLTPNECIVRLGWGGGWLSKTFTSLIKDKHSDFFNQNKVFFGDRKEISAQDFPKSRRFVVRGGVCMSTLGWVKLKFPREGIGTTEKVVIDCTKYLGKASSDKQSLGTIVSSKRIQPTEKSSILTQKLGDLVKNKPPASKISKGSLLEAKIERTDGHMADMMLLDEIQFINKMVKNVRLPFGQIQQYQKGQTVTIQVENIKDNTITKCKIISKNKTL